MLDRKTILHLFKEGKITEDEVNTMLDAIQPKQQNGKVTVTCKIGEKGGLCIYGLATRPTHFYISQWDNFWLPENQKIIHDFVKLNRHKFSTKFSGHGAVAK